MIKVQQVAPRSNAITMLTFFRIAILVFCARMSWGIIKGIPAPDYPFYVVVQRADHKCGGTLVGKDAVMTAAHCLYFDTENRWASPEEVYILHGDVSSSKNWKLRYHSCEKFVVHYKYVPFSGDDIGPFDVAVVKLEDSVKMRNSYQPPMLQPCRADRNRWRKQTSGFAIGLGLSKNNPVTPAEKLMETKFEKIDCLKYDFSPAQDFAFVQYCFISPERSFMTTGDFGGPIIFKPNGRAHCLLGVSSFTLYSSLNSYFANIFTSAGYIFPWLRRVFKYNFTRTSYDMDEYHLDYNY